MSGTQAETVTKPPSVIVATRTRTIDGTERELADVVAGGKTITFRKLDVVDTWNLAEVAPANASPQWRNMTLLTMAVTDINSKPVYGHTTRINLNDLRDTMRRIGADGIAAIAAGLTELDPTPEGPEAAEEGHKATVGNSLETAGSVS